MIRLAIVGTGGMANSHVKAFKDIPGCAVVACCDVVPGRAQKFAEQHGIPKAYENLEKMLTDEKLHGVSIVTNDSAHAAVALQVIEHGIHVMCEKPLATSLADAKRMRDAARRKKLLTAVNFSYRNCYATQKAAEMVAKGELGRVLHVEGSYLQSWLADAYWGDWRKTEAFLWRLSTKHGSAGTLGDLGVHLYDLASFVVGDITTLACTMQTFDKGVKKIGPYHLDTNDSVVTTAHFKNGALGTLHTTRWASGHHNTVALRVYGEKGGLDLNLDRHAPNALKACLGSDMRHQCWWPVRCPPTPNMYERFVDALRAKKQGQTSFEGATRVQAYLHASMQSAQKGGAFIKINA